jgi:hypothetical protein
VTFVQPVKKRLIFLQNSSPLAYNKNKIINASWEIKIITCLGIEKLGKYVTWNPNIH